jgi:hypothetical protein
MNLGAKKGVVLMRTPFFREDGLAAMERLAISH